MKKQHIILASVLAVLLIAGGIFFFFSGKSDQSFSRKNAEEKVESVSLKVGDSVNIFADESLSAKRIMVCGDSGCGFSGDKNQGRAPQGGSAPSADGESPQGDFPSGEGRQISGTMISGTITSMGDGSLTVDTDNGETKTFTVSDSTEITRR